MPSLKVLANTVAQAVAAERENARWAVKSITIDNDGGAGDRAISVVDSFTPNDSNGATGTARTITRFRATILQGDVVTFNEQDLKGVRCLGALTISSDVIDANCHITVGYEPE